MLRFEFWLNKLNQFNGDYLKAETVKAYISTANIANASARDANIKD